MTKKLYYEDPYLRTFKAEIIDIIPDENRFGIVLDQTSFYPEGGGQPGDRGWLNDLIVSDTQIREQTVLHFVEKQLKKNDVVAGKIDWNRRFDLMQQHTGQHILSESFIKTLNSGTLSVHFGEQSSTMDIDRSGLDWEEAERVEIYANGIVFENRSIIIHWIDDPKKLKNFPLRKKPPKGKKIRIVEVSEFDYSPCGGTHVKRTGEIGFIKIRRWERIKGNVRIEFFCGKRALNDYQWKNRTVLNVAEQLTIKDNDLENTVLRLNEENKLSRKKMNYLSAKILDYEFQDLAKEGEQIEDLVLMMKIFHDRDSSDIRNMALRLSKESDRIILFANLTDKVNLFFARSENIKIDMNQLIQDTCVFIDGRGGGRSEFAQGGGKSTGLNEAMKFARDAVKRMI